VVEDPATQHLPETEPHGRLVPPPPVELGRFVILQRIGQGGMGVVYTAYDPELDRKVAVKLLNPSLSGSDREDIGRARLLREAQAMARLSHPNVVAIHDVGTHEDQVFIAMELVDGLPLTAWLTVRPRTWREVLDVFLAAGRGLAAAHRAGLVHGDFKPDNVIIDNDGQARVLDFGLAFAQDRGERPPIDPEVLRSRSGRSSIDISTRLTRTGALTGTPAYISPEQFLGESASARSDQFSFCVSLYEGLYGERPFPGDNLKALRESILLGRIADERPGRKVPAWLRRLLLRGLARDPAQRFADMPALLAALGRDPGRRRLRIILGALTALVLTAAALAYRWYLITSYAEQQAAQQAVCAPPADSLAGVWDRPTREQVRDALLATKVPFAADAAARVEARIDEYAAAWLDMRTDACKATYLRGEQSPALLDLRMACLHRRRGELRSLVEVLAAADAGVVEHATEAAAALPGLAACADTPALLAGRPPPADPEVAAAAARLHDQLARANALERTLQIRTGLELTGPALPVARALGDPSLVAEALLRHGALLSSAGDGAAAEQALTEAFFTAESTRAPALTAETAIAVMQADIDLSNLPAARRWARHAQALVARLALDSPGESERLEAALLNVLGTLHTLEGALAQAEADYTRALALRGRSRDVNAIEIAGLHNNLGNLRMRTGDLAGAQEQLELAVRQYGELLGKNHPRVGVAHSNLGNVMTRRGQYVDAQARFELARTILGAGLGHDHFHVGVTHNNLGDVLQLRGQPVAAREHYDRAVAIFTASFGADAPPLAFPLTGTGECLVALGKPAEAVPTLERALALRAADDRTELARTRFALARALWPEPSSRPRARELATRARDDYRAASLTHARELGDVEAWLGAHGGP